MITFVFLISVFNLALGFGLAVTMERAPAWWQRRCDARAARRIEATSVQAPQHAQGVAAPDPAWGPPPTPVVELPGTWLSTLEQEPVVATSFVEASVQVLRLEVGRYRERLLEIDARLRSLADAAADQDLTAIASELVEVNREWLTKQADAAGHLSTRRGNLGAFEEAGHELETTLMDQAAQIETTLSNLAALDTTDVPIAHKKLVREICRLVDLAHALRDRMTDSLVSIMVAEKKIGSFERKYQVDTLTALPNRFGFEVLLQDWWREDLTRQRLVSCVLIDIDRIARLNEKYGARRVDWIIGGLGRWIAEQLRRDRGFDRAVRLSGQSILLFLGDTGPRNATSAAERIRQTLEVTSFEIADELLELTASFGVVEIDKKDTGATLVKRLQQTLRHAKQAGRNKTSLDEGNGPQDFDPPQFQVKARVVRLQEE